MDDACFEWNASATGDGPATIVQVSLGMRTARDLRSLLLEALYALDADSGQTKNALCLLLRSGFTRQRLQREFDDIQRVIRPDLRERIQVLDVKSPAELTAKLLPGVSEERRQALQRQVIDTLFAKPKTSSREAVIGQLLHRWIKQLEPVSTKQLAELSGASLPTVYAALKTLDPACLQRDDERRIFLAGFRAQDWQQWLTLSAESPSVTFVDRSGAPRSPQKLARALAKLNRSDVAVGGVLGAMHYFPELDITAAPHLDVVVHGGPSTDLSFVTQMDPGLERDDSPKAFASVVVHFVNRPFSLFENQEGMVWADVLECLVHLWDARLIYQVEHLINHIAPVGVATTLRDLEWTSR